MMSDSQYPFGRGLSYQEAQAWEEACRMLTRLDGTLSMSFKDDGITREFDIIYIPLPTKEES